MEAKNEGRKLLKYLSQSGIGHYKMISTFLGVLFEAPERKEKYPDYEKKIRNFLYLLQRDDLIVFKIEQGEEIWAAITVKGLDHLNSDSIGKQLQPTIVTGDHANIIIDSPKASASQQVAKEERKGFFKRFIAVVENTTRLGKALIALSILIVSLLGYWYKKGSGEKTQLAVSVPDTLSKINLKRPDSSKKHPGPSKPEYIPLEEIMREIPEGSWVRIAFDVRNRAHWDVANKLSDDLMKTRHVMGLSPFLFDDSYPRIGKNIPYQIGRAYSEKEGHEYYTILLNPFHRFPSVTFPVKARLPVIAPDSLRARKPIAVKLINAGKGGWNIVDEDYGKLVRSFFVHNPIYSQGDSSLKADLEGHNDFRDSYRIRLRFDFYCNSVSPYSSFVSFYTRYYTINGNAATVSFKLDTTVAFRGYLIDEVKVTYEYSSF